MAHPFGSSPPEHPDEVLVHDAEEECPYIPGEISRLPLRLQLNPHSKRLDDLMELGHRRVGPMMYTTECPRCNACTPVRIPIADFKPSRSQRRIWRKNRDLRVVDGPPRVCEERLDVFNRHRLERGLASETLDEEGFAAWLVQSWTRTRELSFWVEDRLIGFSILDVGIQSVSAVYTAFDPGEHRRSLGIHAVLIGIEWARRMDVRDFHLGLLVLSNQHLEYKTAFLPQERLLDGEWQRFEKEQGCPLSE